MKLEKSLKILDYKIINVTSIEQNDKTNVIPPEKLPRLLRLNGTPWTSERFCHFPQRIIIKFPHLVNISQINILSNSKKISRRLQFYYYFPDDFEKNIKYKENEIPFKKLGFVNLRDNKQCNYSVRELKKIFIKIRCLYLKIELENNYQNSFNKFQQVGLSSVEFFGRFLGKEINMLTNYNNDDDIIRTNIERILKEVCPDTYDNLKKFVNNKKNMDYVDYEEIKGRLDELVNDAKKIYQIELLEKEASKDNDFDKAIEFKNKKEDAKYILKNKALEINKLYKNEFDNNNANLEKENYNNNNNLRSSDLGKENDLRNSKDFKENEEESYTYNKNMKKNLSAPEISTEKEKQIIPQIIPQEEIDPKHLKDFQSLISLIDQNGLRNLLSSKMGNKLEGIKTLNSKLDEIFSNTNGDIKDKIYELINLLGLILEDKNTLFLKPVTDLIEGVITRISENEDLKNDSKLKNLINKNIMPKIRENIGTGGELKKLGKLDKPTELFLSILDKNILNLDNMIKSLLDDDISLLNSEDDLGNNNQTNNNKIYSKLNIIKKVLEDFDDKVENNITTKESFPKDMVADFILSNMKSKDSKIKKIIDGLIRKYIELFGLEDFKEKSLFYFTEESEFKKLSNSFPSLKPLLNQFLENAEEVNIFIPYQKQKKEKEPLIQNSFEINYTNKNSQKKEKDNICKLCKNNIGSLSIEEHNKECKMYAKCEGCGEFIKVEKLNNHRLNFCKNKKNYKQCNKCKEAILSDLYNLHVNKNICNPIKINMSRCPFCHHDIEKDEEGFYQHLIIDGCAYQTKIE